ncbi:MAG: hypothetical protein Kow00124_01820 [Anaerolineae bacterium]
MSSQPEGDIKTQEELLNDLEYGTPEERTAALSHLALVGDADALDAVVEYLQEHSPNDGGGLSALNVLAHKYMPANRYGLAEVVIPYLSDDSWHHRLIAVRLLNTHPNEMAIEPLRELVYEAREKAVVEQRRRFSPIRLHVERTLGESILALANCGRLLVLPDILDLLEDPSLRVIATRALGVIGSDTERPRLEDLIEDGDPNVRDAAQWALGLMDERMEQFLNPPSEIPEPPPDRLHPVYWAHRQLHAHDDPLIQFLVVRLAIEHLLLDTYMGEGRGLEQCSIVLRSHQGAEPPDFRSQPGTPVGAWRYTWMGPTLRRLEGPPPVIPTIPPSPGRGWSGAAIVLSYPAGLSQAGSGLISLDGVFEPSFGRGGHYRVARRSGEWSFVLHKRTWAV